jgi:hypothetical protein
METSQALGKNHSIKKGPEFIEHSFTFTFNFLPGDLALPQYR